MFEYPAPGYVYILACDECPLVYVGSTNNPIKRIKQHLSVQGTWRASNYYMRNCLHALKVIGIYATIDRFDAYALEKLLQDAVLNGTAERLLDILPSIV